MKKFTTLSLSYEAEAIEDIKVEKQGFSLQNLVGAAGKHAMQSCKVKIKDRNAINLILKAKDYVYAKVYDGEQCIFEGVIKPFVSITASGSILESVSLDIMDYTELLDKHVFMDLSKFGKKNIDNAIIARKWKGQTVQTILTDLFALAGISALDELVFEPAAGLQNTFTDFRIVDGDNLHQVIDDFCFENLVDYRFNVGKVVIYPTDVFAASIPITDYRLKVRMNRGKDTDDGVKLTYQTFTTERLEIYHEDNRFDAASWKTIATWEPHKGHYYNRAMHDNEAAPTEYTAIWDFKELEERVGKVTVVDVLDAEITPKLHDEKGVDITAHLDKYDETGGCAYISYDGEFNWLFGKGWGFEYSVHGNVSYKKAFDIPLAVGLKPKKISLKYLDEFEKANRFGEVYQKRQQQTSLTYEFTSNQILEPGKCYILKEDTVLGVSSAVRILSSSYDQDSKLYNYKAEGANDMAVIPLQQLPAESSGNKPAIPQEQADFFYLTCSRAFFLREETTESASLTAHGIAIKQAQKIEWIFNGSHVESDIDVLNIPVSELKLGHNTVICRAVIDTRPYERTVEILKTNTNDSAMVQYRWGSSPDTPPYTEGGLWFWNGKVILFNKQAVGNMNSEEWIPEIPGKTEAAPYLWMRVSTNGGASWSYTRLPGADDVSFSIHADSLTYPWSVRGATVAPTSIKLSVEKRNTIGACTWESVPKIFEPVTADEYVCTIPSGFQGKKITIKGSVFGVGFKELTLTAREVGSNTPVYIGDAYTFEQLDAMPANPMGFPWVAGDHALVIKKNGDKEDPIPYVYHEDAVGESHWRMLQKSDKNIAQVMRNALYDVVDHGSMDMSCAALYGFFEELAAVNAFIENLQSKNLLVQDPNEDPDNPIGMSVQLATYGIEGKPVCVIKYGTKTIFQVDPESGRVFLGQPNSTLTAPLSGFMYKPTETGGEIVGPNGLTRIGANGALIAQHVSIEGGAQISSGYFNGQFNCHSIYTDIQATSIVRQDSWSESGRQVYDFINSYYPEIIIKDEKDHSTPLIKCKLIGGSSKIAYMRATYNCSYNMPALRNAAWVLQFFDDSYNLILDKDLGVSIGLDNATADQAGAAGLVTLEFFTGNLTLHGSYIRGGLSIETYTGGNILKLNVLEAPSTSTINAFPHGQVYVDAEGNVKMKL